MAEHHVCSRACQDAQRKGVFKNLNLSTYESKKLDLRVESAILPLAHRSLSAVGDLVLHLVRKVTRTRYLEGKMARGAI